MSELNRRYDEMLPTLPAERAVFEAIFRHEEPDGTIWIYHLGLVGEHGSGLTETAPIDQVHAAYSRTVKEPGWERLDPKLMLTPAHLRDQMQHWGKTGQP